jgi:hypothetical protein
MRLAAGVFGVVILLGLCAVSSSASAFEREWHVGAAAGASTGQGLQLSPALGVYAAYGLSDVFDARMEVTARGYHLLSDDDPNALSAMLGVAYKLDVLRWVPWAGAYVGYLGFLDVPRLDLPFKQHDVAIGLGLGLDYGISRSLGLGVTLHFDDALSRAETSTFDALLRAEYRWGW